MALKLAAFVLVPLIGALSISAQTPSIPDADWKQLTPAEMIEALRFELDSLQRRLETTEQLLEFYRKQEVDDHASALSYVGSRLGDSTAELSPSELHHYQHVWTESGLTLLISLVDVVPYLDGYRITVDIGNPSSSSLDGFALTASWAWDGKAGRFKKENFTSLLRAGYWTSIELILPDTKPDQIKSITIGVQPDVIKLSR